ncbi:hypothetical protein ACFZB7_03830, partial [Pseudomonas monteilii]
AADVQQPPRLQLVTVAIAVRRPEHCLLSIDTKGNNLFEQNKARFNERKGAVIEKINSQVRFIK